MFRPQISLDWKQSLRFRLLVLGIVPIVVAFPLVILVLGLIGERRADALLDTNVRGYVAGAQGYLDRTRSDLSARVERLARSERLREMFRGESNPVARSAQLNADARGNGMDFLIVVDEKGRILASSDLRATADHMPWTPVVEQAHNGITTSGFERLEVAQLIALAPELASRFEVASTGMRGEGPRIVITAGAHVPLSVDLPDAIVLGGIVLDRNFALVEHMRHTVFPIGGIRGAQDGVIAIFNGATGVLFSGQFASAEFADGVRANDRVVAEVLHRGELAIQEIQFPTGSHLIGFQALHDSANRTIGMVAAGILVSPYRDSMRDVLKLVAAIMLATMLLISLIFIRAGSQINDRLRVLGDAMDAVRRGERSVRLKSAEPGDEIEKLGLGFNVLLDALQEQDKLRQAALDDLSDEVSMRKSLFEAERDGVAILLADGTVYDVNPKCAEMLGCSVSEIKRSSFLEREPDWTIGPVLERLAAGTQRDAFLESTLVRAGGGDFLAEISLSTANWRGKTFVLLLLRDISARRSIERELEAHRQHLEQLVEVRTRELNHRSAQLNGIIDLSPDGFVLLDERRRVAFANASFLEMTGLRFADVHDVEESAFSDLLGHRSEIRARFPGVATLALGNGDRASVRDTHVFSRHRVVHHQAVFELAMPFKRTIEVRYKRAEGISGMQILYFRDVTREAEIDAMKSEFLATAAHELRTPMASIYGYSELLLHQELDAQSQREMLETIHDQAALIESIVSELLDLSRIEARRGKDFVFEDTSMNELVRAVTRSYKPPPTRDAPWFTPAATNPVVKVDRQKLSQAITNVLSNAYKYSPEGGSVAIGVVQDAPGAEGMVGVRIRDQGMGMSPDQAARIFERFFRVDSSGRIPGSGLGMPIVKEIIDIHDGLIDIDTALGQGMTVTLWVPAADATAEAGSSRSA